MKKRVAVISDAVSDDFYFPLWLQYYGSLFGSENIYLFTTQDKKSAFTAYNLGEVIELEYFNNSVRREVISRKTTDLLTKYDNVIRVDTDEFLVADPLQYKSLNHYIEDCKATHTTARGFNIVPDHDSKSLEPNNNILIGQRRLVYPYDALCKTSIVRVPTEWSPGFHFCSHQPAFSSLFLFHLKLADIDIQLSIGSAVASTADEPNFIDYHLTDRETLVKRSYGPLNYDRVQGVNSLYRDAYIQDFVSKIHFSEAFGGVFHGGSFAPETVIIELGAEFDGIF